MSLHSPSMAGGTGALRSASHGATMIEVLVALVLLVVGLLGLASLTLNSIRFADDAGLRTVAISLAYDITDRLRMNIAGRPSYTTTLTDNPVVTTDCSSSSCTPEALAAWDLNRWKTAVSVALPTAQSSVTRASANGPTTVTIRWVDRGTIRNYALVAPY